MAKNGDGTGAKRPNKILVGRTLTLMAVCGIVAFLVLAVRLYHVMITQHDYYEGKAVEQQTRETTIHAARGTIYDTNGKILAMSATVETVYISPYEMVQYEEDAELIARGLSQILEVDYDSIIEKSKDTKSWYKTVKTKIEKELADEVREFIDENKLKSVHLEEDSKRYYPYGTLACHLVGFVGSENSGLEGTEAYYNGYLEGTDGKVVRMTNARGTDMIFDSYEDYYSAEDGCDVTLTVDSTIQYYLEKHLQQAVEDYDVQNGACAIAMDPDTGAILGMVSLDNYDLNDYLTVSEKVQTELDEIEDEDERQTSLADAQRKQWRNKAISDTYEPGSVFKIITLSMALEEGVISESDSFFCGGTVQVQGDKTPRHCWKSGGHGSQTLTQVVQHSCNVAFVNIGLKVGAEKFYDYVRAFGLFETTGIDISGESGSIWWSSDVFCDPLNQSQLAAASFGQTFNVTPLQMITAVCAATNGGYLMEPYIVEKITDPDGGIVEAHEPTVVRQVISEATSEKVCSILEKVVGDPVDGTGKNAYVAGYRIGGKTGTSEKVANEAATGEKEYIVSFLGIAPADDPQIAILVLLDTPSDSTGIYISGGVMAAPTVGKMMADILPYLGVEPEYTDEELKDIDRTVPFVKEKTVSEATADMEAEGFEVKVVGNGDTVTDQLPAANSTVAAGTKVILYAGEDKPGTMVSVPDLTGMTLNQAKSALESRGLYLSTNGYVSSSSSTSVSKQTQEAGTEVAYGSVVGVTMVDNSNQGRY